MCSLNALLFEESQHCCCNGIDEPEFSSAKTDLMGAAGGCQVYCSVSRAFSTGGREIIISFNNESNSGDSSHLHLYTYIIFTFNGISRILLFR